MMVVHGKKDNYSKELEFTPTIYLFIYFK
jgi:hypothetical protein